MKQRLITGLLGLCALLFVSLGWAVDVTVQGLYKGGAILFVDGKQRSLKEGETTPEGIKLIAADTQQAVLEINGERQTVGLSKAISTRFRSADKSEVRIASGLGGHFMTPGSINGITVDFMVDTGATVVAMNRPTAERIGLNFRAGVATHVQTANGVAPAYNVILDSVRIGALELKGVAGTVTVGDFPTHVLLGNSFLNRVDLRRENGVLILETSQ